MQLLISILLGAVAGWLAGSIMKMKSGGILLYIVLGIVGSFVGNWLFNLLGLSVSGGWSATLLTATTGAIALIIAGRVLFGKKSK